MSCPPLPRRTVLGALAAAALAGVPAPATARGARPERVLVFSRTTGFRHASIGTGVATVQELGAEAGFGVEATEDEAVFRDRTLRGFTAVVFLNTTGDVLDERGRAALRRFVTSGGGWVGVHSAADSEYTSPFHTRLLAGARFLCHPVQQPGVVVREDAGHRSTAHLPERWLVPFEEFYSFTDNPRGRARILLSIDESTYLQDPNTSNLPGGTGLPGLPAEPQEPVSGVMGDHPMAWQHRVGRGLSWYTALGHEAVMYELPEFRQHLLGGLLTASRHGARRLG